MDLEQAVLERRSVRRFNSDPVSEEDVRSILEAARWAPSWANTQCWRFVVVRDPQVREALAGTLTPTNRGMDALRKAPVAIAVCAELGRAGFKQGQATTDKGDWFMFDCGLAVQNMVLAAHSLGLGTVIIGLMDAKGAAKVLMLPDNIAFVALMPLGHPDHRPIAPPRKELSDLVYYDRYGNPAR
ncbi:MAG: nitroreductase family protein [Chloroflexi bacterium]|nr:nitroreductase family protein [Chloroflexota bacterium]